MLNFLVRYTGYRLVSNYYNSEERIWSLIPLKNEGREYSYATRLLAMHDEFLEEKIWGQSRDF